MLKSPVLFIIFNRCDTAQAVFNEIKKARPEKLYIHADGARSDIPEDEERCRQTRAIADQINWPCEVHKKFLNENLGCDRSYVSAIDWVFETEEKAIILEDDVVPSQAFFNYCWELLERYKDDQRIFVISGSCFYRPSPRNGENYVFSKYGLTWGWATWKRAWQHYDYYMKKWPQIRSSGHLHDAFSSKQEANYFSREIEKFYSKISCNPEKPHNWELPHGFSVWINSGLCINPTSNLITNIGTYGTHTQGFFSGIHQCPRDESYKIEKHPDFFLPDRRYERYFFRRHFIDKKRLSKRLLRKGLKIFKAMHHSLLPQRTRPKK